ncbi:MAG: DUF4097 family beta strand repeat-containing protein [Acidobacteriota bacterium]
MSLHTTPHRSLKTPLPLTSATSTLAILLGAALFLGALPAFADDDGAIRRIEQSFFAGDAKKIEVDLTVGSLQVEGVRGRNAEVELILTCDRTDSEACKRRANRIQLVPRISGDRLYLKLKRTSRARLQGISADMRLRLPRDLAVEVDLAGGDVVIKNMRSHLEVDSAAGDVDIVFPEKRVASVNLDVGVGSADLWLEDSRVEGRGFPRSVTWRGSGEANLEVDLGAGDITVRLE